MNSGKIQLVCIVAAIVVFFIIIVYAFLKAKKEEKRCKDIENYCKKNNFKYFSELNDIPEDGKGFSIFNHRGHSARYYAGMVGEQGDNSFQIFDYYYETGNVGKNRVTYDFTVCLLSNKKAKMPQFFVRDEDSILDSLGKLFGGQDINFDEDPVFSPKFILQGLSEKDIRAFFDDRVRTAFVNNHTVGYVYEGRGDSIMVFVEGSIDLDLRIKIFTVAKNLMEVIVSKSNTDNTNANS